MSKKSVITRLSCFLFLILHSTYVTAGWRDFIDIFTEDSVSDVGSNVLKNDEIISGLKEALIKGTQSAVGLLGKEDGFWTHPKLKIPMPEKLELVESALRKLNQDEIADQFVLSLNRAAEKAVPEAMSIFSNTIKTMSIEDAKSILDGSNTAATDYLRDKGGAQLHQRFLPIVNHATNSVGVTEKYKALIDNLGVMANYIDIESLDIDRYVTDKAIDGLFTLVAKEEKLIRKNPAARTTELLKKVFQ